MNRARARVAPGVALLLLAAVAADAQTVLQLPAGTRALGVGDAFVAGRGSEVIFYNPALIALQPGPSVSVQRFGDASTSGALASTYSAGPIAAGVGALFLDYGSGIPSGVVTRSIMLGQRGPEAASSLAGLVAVASTFKGTRVGVAAKFLEERVGSIHGSVAAFDVGAARDMFSRATVGLAVQNIGEELHLGPEAADLPTRATLGIAASTPPLGVWFDVAASAAITYRRDGEILPAGGVEVSYVPLDGWTFTGRVGARRIADEFGAGAFTLGAGASFDRLSVDYAFQPLDGPGASHRVGIRVR